MSTPKLPHGADVAPVYDGELGACVCVDCVRARNEIERNPQLEVGANGAQNSERVVKYEIRKRLGRMPDVLLYNNPVGLADYDGKAMRAVLGRIDAMLTSPRGQHVLARHPQAFIERVTSLISATLKARPRTFPFGLAPGSSDLVGIGPGGVFLALEVKTATGRTSKAQRQFVELVQRYGGRAEIVRSADEAEVVIEAMRGVLYARVKTGESK